MFNQEFSRDLHLWKKKSSFNYLSTTMQSDWTVVDSHAGHKKKRTSLLHSLDLHTGAEQQNPWEVCAFPAQPRYLPTPSALTNNRPVMPQCFKQFSNCPQMPRTIFIIIPTQANFHQTPVEPIFGYPQFQSFTFSLKHSYELSNFSITPRSPGRNPHSETLSERHEHAT